MCKIRNLRADEIECRIGRIYGDRLMLMLYKDARCDMKILDETFTSYGWERTHEVINGNLFCTVKIKNPETGEWIVKQDVGTQSNTEKEKGEASDAFKRACTNVGIGRELYSSPAIWINIKPGEIESGKLKSGVEFFVSCIETDEDKQITFLNIIDKDTNNRFTWNKASLKYNEIITKSKSEAPETKNEAPEVPEIPQKQPEPISEYVSDKDRVFIIEAFKKSIGRPKENPEIYQEILHHFGADSTEQVKLADLQNVIDYINSYKQKTA